MQSFLSERLDRGRPLWKVSWSRTAPTGAAAALFKAPPLPHRRRVGRRHAAAAAEPAAYARAAAGFAPRARGVRPFRCCAVSWRPARSCAQGVLGFARRAGREPRAALDFLAPARGHRRGDAAALRRGSATVLNAALGPDRRLETLHVELEDIKQIRRALGGTLNDVAVAMVTGALASYLRAPGEPVATSSCAPRFDEHAQRRRARHARQRACGASRRRSDRGARPPAPLRDRAQDDGRAQGLEAGARHRGAELLAERTTPSVLTQRSRLALQLHSTHVMITNIRGPAVPLYCSPTDARGVSGAAASPGQVLRRSGCDVTRASCISGFVADAARLADLECRRRTAHGDRRARELAARIVSGACSRISLQRLQPQEPSRSRRCSWIAAWPQATTVSSRKIRATASRDRRWRAEGLGGGRRGAAARARRVPRRGVRCCWRRAHRDVTAARSSTVSCSARRPSTGTFLAHEGARVPRVLSRRLATTPPAHARPRAAPPAWS